MSKVSQSRNGHNGSKGLPENPEAEAIVLGSALASSDFAPLQSLSTDDFSIEKHRCIYRSMANMHECGESIDFILLIEELNKHRDLEKAGGRSYLAELMQNASLLATGVDRLVRLLKEKTLQRRFALGTHGLSERCLAGTDDTGQLLESGERLMQELQALRGVAEAADAVVTQIPSTWKYEVHTTYLIEDLLPEGCITMWSGESGDGKSTLALAAAASVVEGQAFLGRKCMRRPVLYMDRENGLPTIKGRLLRLRIPDMSDRFKIWGRWWQGHYPPGPESLAVVAYAQRLKPLIIWDSLVAFAGCDENSATEMRHHMSLYQRLTSLGATVLIIHHRSDKGQGKNQTQSDYRGSSDIRAAVDSAWRISRDDNSCAADALGRLVLRPYKTRIEQGHPIRIEYRDDCFMPLDVPKRPDLDIVIELVTVYPGSSQEELRKLGMAQGLGDKRLRAVLNEAVLAGKIEVRKGSHNTYRHYPREVSMATTV